MILEYQISLYHTLFKEQIHFVSKESIIKI